MVLVIVGTLDQIRSTMMLGTQVIWSKTTYYGIGLVMLVNSNYNISAHTRVSLIRSFDNLLYLESSELKETKF